MTCQLHELNRLRCRWPLAALEDEPPYIFCGELPLCGSPYCLEHSKLAYNASRPRLVKAPPRYENPRRRYHR